MAHLPFCGTSTCRLCRTMLGQLHGAVRYCFCCVCSFCASLHDFHSSAFLVHFSLWYLLTLKLFRVASVIFPSYPALRMAESMASTFVHPCAGITSGRYVAVSMLGSERREEPRPNRPPVPRFFVAAGAGVEEPEEEEEEDSPSRGGGTSAGFGRWM